MWWIWIIIALIVIAGLFFWMRSGKEDSGTDMPSAPKEPKAPEAPETPVPTETPSESSDDSSEEKPM